MALFKHFAMCCLLQSNHLSLQTFYSTVCLVDIKNSSNPPSTIVLFLPHRAGCPGETCTRAVILSQGKNSCNSKSWMSISLQLRMEFCSAESPSSKDGIPDRLHQAYCCFLCFFDGANIYSQQPLLLLAPCSMCNAFFPKTISIGTSESSSCICEKAQ